MDPMRNLPLRTPSFFIPNRDQHDPLTLSVLRSKMYRRASDFIIPLFVLGSNNVQKNDT